MRALLPSANAGNWHRISHTNGAGEGGGRQQRPPVEQPHAVPDHAAGHEGQRLPAIPVGSWYSGAGAPQSAIDEAPIR